MAAAKCCGTINVADSAGNMLLISHADCEKHDAGPGQPESPDRLAVLAPVLQRLQQRGHRLIQAPRVDMQACARVHSRAYLDTLEATALCPRQLDYDTYAGEQSWTATRRAAGAAVAAVDAVLAGEASSVFCAVRPPGHHATPKTAMGFCLLNSIAIAARHATDHHGLERVAIFDFDVHHGNGTQDVFANDKRVAFISSHQMPLYPGTGHPSERGVGNITNIALTAGTDSALYRQRFEREILPTLLGFRPQLLLVSAGFDAHRSDPLSMTRLETDDYGWLSAQLHAVCSELSIPGPIALLEGGYDLGALKESVEAFIEA